jgi:predicted TIM-barrel fold metal-dependent hydrolase
LFEVQQLVVVGGHAGYPWTQEVLSLARKCPNFYIDTSAYAVHRLPDDIVAFSKGSGRDRVMVGTNWPMLTPQQSLAQLDELELDEETTELFLSENAIRVFQL